MGTYDPPPGATDDENQMGFITGAFLQFPTEYTFSVIGKTVDGDAYANDVKRLMESILGSDARMETRVAPRGTKFTIYESKRESECRKCCYDYLYL